MAYASLHTHSHYSLLDAVTTIPRMIEVAKKKGIESLALTDHGNMFGAVSFYNACTRADINPVIGCEVYVAVRSHKDRERISGKNYYHLILLAENDEGYRNLVRLCSLAYTNGFYYRPRIDCDLLKENSSGLIALSGCMSGEVPQYLLREDMDAARKAAQKMLHIMGEENYFLEIQSHGMDEENIINPGIEEIGKDLDIPLVVTNDCHYAEEEDHYIHDLLLCVGTGKALEDQNRKKYPGTSFFLKNESEMKALFSTHHDAVERTAMIASRCKIGLLDKRGYQIPKFSKANSADNQLRSLCLDGLQERYHPDMHARAHDRLDKELAVIKETKFADYFLIVWDIIRFARDEGILVGPGRGSAAGSLVSYVLRITDVDPLRFGLLFERFLNPERISMPDIDTDIEDAERETVLRYIRDRYGSEHVARIITFSTLRGKQALHDVGRVLGATRRETEELAGCVLATPAAPMTLPEVRETDAKLQGLLKRNESYKKIWDSAERLEGTIRHSSVHPAGVVIGVKPLRDIVPLCTDTRSDEIMCQFEGSQLEDMGLLKMDFLGLKNLTVIRKCLAFIHSSNKKSAPDMSTLDLSDGPTFDILQHAHTVGIFQLESAGMRELLRKLKVDKFTDLSALIALYRPGPLGSGFTEKFIAAKLEKRISNAWIENMADTVSGQALKSVLSDTYGVYVYQEQVMQSLQIIGGFSLSEADIARKAMGKKSLALMESLRNKFISGGMNNGHKEDALDKLFDQFLEFGRYAFNKSHSVAYAYITYQTAYLKVNHPVEYMSALLDTYSGNTDILVRYVNEAKRMGMKILNPDINLSKNMICPEDGSIRYSLSALIGIGSNVTDSIINERDANGDYENPFDFASRIPDKIRTRKNIMILIDSGAFDRFGEHRGTLHACIDRMLSVKGKNENTLQESLFSVEDDPWISSIPKSILDLTKAEKQQAERKVFGCYLSLHPLSEHMDAISKKKWLTIHDIVSSDSIDINDGAKFVMAAIITDMSYRKSRANPNRKWATVILQDLSGSLECRVSHALCERYEKRENDRHEGTDEDSEKGKLPVDVPLMVCGRVSSFGDRPTLNIDDISFLKDALSSGEELPLNKARSTRPRPTAHISIDPSIKKEDIEKLHDILFSLTGKRRAYLHLHSHFYTDGKERMQVLKETFWADFNQLEEALTKNEINGIDLWSGSETDEN